MGFDDIEKILEAIKKRPVRTGLIICVLVGLFISGTFLNSYLGEIGKNSASSGEGGGGETAKIRHPYRS